MAAAAPKMAAAAAPASRTPENKKGVITLVLGACILFLSIATFVLMAKKQQQDPYPGVPVVVGKEPSTQPTGPVGYATKADVEAAVASLNTRLDKLGESHEKWKHRVWLLAVAHNENVAVTKTTECQRYGVTNANYIVFDENWRLSRMPSTIQFNADQQKEIQKSVK